MKTLCSHLSSLLPPRPNKMSVPELVDEAREYVVQMQKRIQLLKQTKVQLEEECKAAKILLPRKISLVIDTRDWDSTLEVNIVTTPDIKLELRHFLIVLQEEGANVISAMYYRAEDRFVCSIISQVYFSGSTATYNVCGGGEIFLLGRMFQDWYCNFKSAQEIGIPGFSK
ncbi:hypothetical protein PTKIN_Ptkin17bG0081300 [Pterospermum kingtungense]